MKRNVGNIDRIVRILLAAVIAVLYFTNVISGTVAIVAGILAVIFAATSLVSFCPIYALFGMSTCPVEEKKA